MAAPQFATPSKKGPSRPRRRFTLDEANRTLPLVSRIVRDIVVTHRRIADIQAKIEQSTAIKDAMALQNDLEAAADRLSEYQAELATIGCELKDREMGLIDFPGKHQGREVCLCWRLGEEAIGFWHETSSGFAGRQPVKALQESE